MDKRERELLKRNRGGEQLNRRKELISCFVGTLGVDVLFDLFRFDKEGDLREAFISDPKDRFPMTKVKLAISALAVVLAVAICLPPHQYSPILLLMLIAARGIRKKDWREVKAPGSRWYMMGYMAAACTAIALSVWAIVHAMENGSNWWGAIGLLPIAAGYLLGDIERYRKGLLVAH